MVLAGSGAQGRPRVPKQKDLRTKRAINRQAGSNVDPGTSGSSTIYVTFANLPKPGNEGLVAYIKDANIFARDNGTSWDYFGPSLSGLNLPQSASFSWLNQGTAAVDFTTGIMVMTQFGNGGSNAIAAQLLTPPSPPFSFFVQVSTNLPASTAAGGNNAEVGIFAWDSVATKGILWGPSWRPASGMSMEYQLFTGTGSAADGPYGNTPAPNNATDFMWLGYQDDGVSLRKLLVGNPDGNRFGIIYQESRTANGGAGANFTPNQIGIGINPCTPATGFQLSITTYTVQVKNS